jgi:hypothetical protein
MSHGARPFVYHAEVTQLAINFEDHTGGAAPWTTSLASAARILDALSMASAGLEI